MQLFDGARLSPNSVRNTVWHALNEPVFQYLRTRHPRYSTVYIENSLGPLARDSPCITTWKYMDEVFIEDNTLQLLEPHIHERHT